MNGLAVILVTILAVWMLVCIRCGMRRRWRLFLAVLAVGLALNMAWMMIGLDARWLEPHAIMAQAAVALYGLSAFGLGWLVGRIRRAWRESAVQ